MLGLQRIYLSRRLARLSALVKQLQQPPLQRLQQQQSALQQQAHLRQPQQQRKARQPLYQRLLLL
jgi:hypothetical protein